MILFAVIVGYLLGALPFLFFYISKNEIRVLNNTQEPSNVENMEEILNEWVNGKTEETNPEPINEPHKISMEESFDEIITGTERGE